MSKKYRVIDDDSLVVKEFGLSIGDIVTKVDGSYNDDLYELPKRLYGRGHNAKENNPHLNLKAENYIYINKYSLEKMKWKKYG